MVFSASDFRPEGELFVSWSFCFLRQIIIIINNNNLFLTRRKLTSEYDQMRLTTITTCNNYQ